MQPFLKWAGGKRWLFDEKFLASLPRFNRYIEPFLGGGAGFFSIEPEEAILSDINPELINLYEAIRDKPDELAVLMIEYQTHHSKEFYYNIRQDMPRDKLIAAARTLYLNRTCWNGLYRLNRAGEFNVPIGTKTLVSLPNDDFKRASSILSRAEIAVCDFQRTIEKSKRGDLLFVDPPYTVKHNMNGFVKYNETIFRWADQVRLRDSLFEAASRGVAIVLTNADHSSVRDLYDGFGEHASVPRQSIISGKATGRAAVTELVVRV